MHTEELSRDDFEPRDLQCVDCKEPFIFTPGEQAFYATRQFSDPKRCKPCRDINKAKKEERNSERGGRSNQERRSR